MGVTDFANNEVIVATGKAGGGSGRQPGSTFKMFALADAVKKGYSIRSVLPAPSKIEIPNPECTRGGEPWKVRGGPGSQMSLVSATKNSVNTVYAQLMLKMTPPDVVTMANQMGVSAELDPVCALVLGGGEVSRPPEPSVAVWATARLGRLSASNSGWESTPSEAARTRKLVFSKRETTASKSCSPRRTRARPTVPPRASARAA